LGEFKGRNIYAGQLCAANQKREFDKLIKLFQPPTTSYQATSKPHEQLAMSSVKRRKADGDVPSGLLKKKKHAAKEQAPVSASTSPEPAAAPEEPQEENVEEATKTFKDLVCAVKTNIRSSNLQYPGNH
jgi:hypothetical protein